MSELIQKRLDIFIDQNTPNESPSLIKPTPYDILVPIYEGVKALRSSLPLLAQHTPAQHRIILLDDASADPEVRPLLMQFVQQRPSTKLVFQTHNLGFPENVNHGLRLSTQDVIVLNADALVCDGWITALHGSAQADDDIGIVCPFSDNATILSVPPQAAQFVPARHHKKPISIPTAVGFCMLIKRRVIEMVGHLDSAFGLGYGEENDFSMRAIQAGFKVVACEQTYIRHIGGVSFKNQSLPPRIQNQALLNARWPNYPDLVSRFERFYPWRSHHEFAARIQSGDSKPGLLHIVHQYGQPGGTEGQVQALVKHCHPHYAQTLLYHRRGTSDQGFSATQTEQNGVRHVQINRKALRAQYDFMGQAAELSDPAVETLLAGMISGGAYSVVHFHHLTGFNSLLLPLLAKRLGCRVVISLHDWHALCPDFNMIARNGLPCGKSLCQATDTDCINCLGGKLQQGRPGNLSEYIALRQQLWRDCLNAADQITTPSAFVRDRISKALGPQLSSKIQIIAPGMQAFEKTQISCIPSNHPLRVGVPGGLSYRKGGQVFLDAVQIVGNTIKTRSFGLHDDRLKRTAEQLGVELSGPYRPEQLSELLRQLDVAILPSLCEETFSLVLSECFAHGIPVIASGLGALAERIQPNETGFLFTPGDHQALADCLDYCASEQGRQHLDKIKQTLGAQPVPDATQMSADYLTIYQQLNQLAELSRPNLSREIFPTSYQPQGLGSNRFRKWRTSQHLNSSKTAFANQSLQVLIFWRNGLDRQLTSTLRNLSQQHWPMLISIITLESGQQADISGLSDEIDVQFISATTLADQWSRFVLSSGANLFMIMEAGDRIDAQFLPVCSHGLLADASYQIAYTDDDLLSSDNHHYQAHLKPEFDIDLFRSTAYVQQGCLYRRSALENLNLQHFAALAELSFQINLGIYAQHQSDAFIRIPKLLYHRADIHVLPGFPQSRRWLDYLSLHLSQCGQNAEITIRQDVVQIEYTSDLSQISILIVSYGDLHALRTCLSRLQTALGAVHPEIIVLTQFDLNTKDLESDSPVPVQVIQFDQSITLMNEGLLKAAHAAQHSALLILDENSEILTPKGIEILSGYWQREQTAAVGPLIAYDWINKTHLGIVLGLGSAGIAGTAGKMENEGFAGRFPRTHAAQGVSALSWRGMLTGKQQFMDCAGFDSRMGIDYCDVDYCLKLGQQQLRCVATPQVLIRLNQPYPLRPNRSELDQQRLMMRQKWSQQLADDPYYHPMLSLNRGDWSIDDDADWVGGNEEADIRIMAYPNDDWASGFYRVRQPLMTLARSGLIKLYIMPASTRKVFPNLSDLKRKKITHLVLHHGFHDYQLQKMADIRQFSQVQIIFSLDDLLTQVPNYNSAAPTIYPDIAKRIEAGFSFAHQLVFSTGPLAEHFPSTDASSVVIENAISPQQWPLNKRKKNHHKIRIGWAGGSQHTADLMRLNSVIDQTKDQLDWVFLGQIPDSLKPYAAEIHPPVAFHQYAGKLIELDLDIAVAPLTDNAFNQCKSALRLLEYGAAGIAAIASHILPYQDCPATICKTDDDWLKAIQNLLDPATRKQKAAEMQSWVLGQHCISHRSQQWLQIFN